MILRAFTYLLLLLMTLQSAISLADAHSAHQSGTEHLSFEDHQHSDNHDHHSNSEEASEDHGNDCHHCCHCHGHSGPAILVGSEPIALRNHSSPIPDYSDNALPAPFEVFLRPPKA